MVHFWGWWVHNQYIRYTVIYGPSFKYASGQDFFKREFKFAKKFDIESLKNVSNSDRATSRLKKGCCDTDSYV